MKENNEERAVNVVVLEENEEHHIEHEELGHMILGMSYNL